MGETARGVGPDAPEVEATDLATIVSHFFLSVASSASCLFNSAERQ